MVFGSVGYDDKKIEREIHNMRIYISGAITGDPDFKSKFLAAESMLRLRGYETINPGKLYIVANGLTWKQYMKVCLKLLRFADGIYMLDGFERSEGAMWEYNRAHLLPNIKKIYLAAEGYPPRVDNGHRNLD